MTKDTAPTSWVNDRIKQDQITKYMDNGRDFIDDNALEAKLKSKEGGEPDPKVVRDILAKSMAIKDLTLDEVAKCCLISMDSTMKSNLSVGLPLDLLCYETDSLRVTRHQRIDQTDPYFAQVRDSWGRHLRKVFDELPDPHYWKSPTP